MQSDDFAVDHDIDGSVQLEFNTMHFADFRERMLNMRSVLQARQIADQANATNWSPANEFD